MVAERRARSSEWLLPVSFALAYFAGAELGHLLSVGPRHFTATWPPGGLYLGVLVFTPSRHWPRQMAAAALAELLSAALHGQVMSVSASFWLAHTLEAVTGAALLRSLFSRPFALDRLRTILGLALVCGLVSAPVGAIGGALTARIAFGAAFGESWLSWWMADVVGILVFAPLVLAFRKRPGARPAKISHWRMLEAGLFVLTTTSAVTVIFDLLPARPLAFAVYPCLLWGVVRFGLRGGAGGLALVSVLAIALTLNGRGPFSATDLPPLSATNLLQLYLCVTALSFLSLAAVIRERDRASRQLARLYDAVRRSEKELRDVIDTIPTGVGAARPDGSMEFVNRRWAEYSGLEDSSGSRWQAPVHPDDLDRHMDKWRASLATGEPFENEVRYRRASDGRYRWFVVRAVPLRDAHGTIRKWYGVSTDIDARKRAEALLAGEKRILEMVAGGDSLAQVLDVLCRFVEEQAPDVLASVLLLDGDRLRHGAAPSLPKAYTDAIDGAVIGPCAGSCGTAAYRGEQVIVCDIATDPLWADYRGLALPHSLRACWSTPVFSSEQKVIATFAMYYREPRTPSARDQEIIEQITYLAGVAIQRTLAQEQLRESEARQRYHAQLLTTVTDNASSMLYIADPVGRGTYVNPAVERITGHRAEELIGHVLHDKIHHTRPDGTPYPVAQCPMSAAVRNGNTVRGEDVFVRKDRTFFPVRYKASPILRDGVPVGTVIEAQDLTDIKAAQEELRKQAALLSLAHDAIIVRDAHSRIVFWNPGAEKTYGWTAEEAIDRISHELLQTRFPVSRNAVDAALQDKGEWEGELTHITRQGTPIVVTSRQSLRRDEHGTGATVLEIDRDVTERARAEYLTRLVFERSPDFVLIVGTDYRYRRVNPVYGQSRGFPTGTVVGMHIADVTGMDVFERTVKPNLDRCFRGEHVAYSEWFTHQARGRVYLLVTYSPLRSGSGEVDAALVIARDLTEHMLAVEALQKAQAELAHVTRVTALGELAASIAHEVNQPLAAIVADANASLNWLSAPRPDLGQVREALEAIVADGHRAAEVIQRIRQLATKSAPQKAHVDLNAVIGEIVPLVRAEVLAHEASLQLELASQLPAVLADRVQLQQVILNLVMNGIEAMASVGDRRRELIIRCTPHADDHVMVAVQDTGVGIDPNIIDNVFSAFFTTKPGGMGMGLSISRSIIEAHGGRLWVTPNEPHGAVFRFALPAANSVL